jgi:hypothetical protein
MTRRAWVAAPGNEVGRSRRHGSEASIIPFDIDLDQQQRLDGLLCCSFDHSGDTAVGGAVRGRAALALRRICPDFHQLRRLATVQLEPDVRRYLSAFIVFWVASGTDFSTSTPLEWAVVGFLMLAYSLVTPKHPPPSATLCTVPTVRVAR